MVPISVEVFWLRLRAILTDFADRLAAVDPMLIRNLGHTANDAFVLRGYLAIRKHSDGNEVAITVDVRHDGQALVVESDICTDDGGIIAAGPSATFQLPESHSDVDIVIVHWLREFERFLLENESVVSAFEYK